MEELKNYLIKREEIIQEILSKPQKKYSIESFHKLRVEIKKLNALLVLLKDCSGKIEKKGVFEPIQELFKQGGKVREIQVENKLLSEYYRDKLLSNYKKNQQNNLKKEKLAFFELVENEFSQKLKFLKDEVIPLVDKLEKDKTEKFLRQRYKRIVKLFHLKKIPKSKAHKLRKELKLFNYCLKMTDSKKYQLAVYGVNDLSELLGEWHDLEVSVVKLKKAKKDDSLASQELIQLKKIRKKLANDADLLFKKIRKTHSSFDKM